MKRELHAPQFHQNKVRESLGIVNQANEASDALAWQLSAEATARVRASEDSREGIAAFLEKRAPLWRGR